MWALSALSDLGSTAHQCVVKLNLWLETDEVSLGEPQIQWVCSQACISHILQSRHSLILVAMPKEEEETCKYISKLFKVSCHCPGKVSVIRGDYIMTWQRCEEEEDTDWGH